MKIERIKRKIERYMDLYRAVVNKVSSKVDNKIYYETWEIMEKDYAEIIQRHVESVLIGE